MMILAKKKTTTVLLTVLMTALLLSACQPVSYLLNDGRYMLRQQNEQVNEPYLLINDGHFTVVMQMAVSYQPGGRIERNGNIVTMQTVYAGNNYRWVFELISDNQLKYLADQSSLPVLDNSWPDGLLFTLVKD